MIKFHVYDATDRYIGGTVHAEDAATLISALGDDATISIAPPTVDADIRARNVLWREGCEDQPAYDSYDHVAEVVGNRLAVL